MTIMKTISSNLKTISSRAGSIVAIFDTKTEVNTPPTEGDI